MADGAAHYTAEQCFNETDGAKRVYQIADGITLEILYNYYYFNSSGDENNYSVACIIKQGENNYFFSGDLEQEGEEKLVSYYENKTNRFRIAYCTKRDITVPKLRQRQSL